MNTVMLALGFDLAVVLLRWRDVSRLRGSNTSRAGRSVPAPGGWFAARLLLLDLLPAVLLIAWPTPLAIAAAAAVMAIASAAAGLAIDRWSFYVLGLQHTTEREVGLVEAAIEGATPHQM